MKSIAIETGSIDLPLVEGEYSMISFDIDTLAGLPQEFVKTVKRMLDGIQHAGGTGYFTIHGKKLKANQTLRRGGPHTDGNYEPYHMTFGNGGGNGWKVGENGPAIDSPLHNRQYNTEKGGIILASNFESCVGWIGEYEGFPGVGGDCNSIELDAPFMLQKNKVYYGNNHFIHESLPVSQDVHRVMARITMPENHTYTGSP